MSIDPASGLPIQAPKLNDTGSSQVGKGEAPGNFKQFLEQSLDEVNRLQKVSEAATEALASGKTDNVTEVYSAVAQAEQAFHLMLEVRNKLVEAYQEVQRVRV